MFMCTQFQHFVQVGLLIKINKELIGSTGCAAPPQRINKCFRAICCFPDQRTGIDLKSGIVFTSDSVDQPTIRHNFKDVLNNILTIILRNI